MNYNREQLYNLVWTKALNAAAADCGITSPVLRQICSTYDVPLPWGGYKPGKERIALPEGQDFELSSAVNGAINSLLFPGENTDSFIVPSKLIDPDPLIIRVQNTTTNDYQFHGMPNMMRAGFGELAVRSSKINMNRAILIMDTLVKAWRHRGYRIVNQDKETTVYLREVSVRVGLRETTTVEPSKERFGSRIHTATGKLAFKVDGWLDREWKDGTVPLESHIHEIIDHMEVTARDLEKSWVENKIRDRQRAEKQQAEALRIKEDAEEATAFESLVMEAQRWQQLQTLDKYLDALVQTVPRSPAFEQWLKWARHRRGIFDPVEKRKTPLL